MNGDRREGVAQPRKGIVGDIPDGFFGSSDDGSRLLALLQQGQPQPPPSNIRQQGGGPQVSHGRAPPSYEGRGPPPPLSAEGPQLFSSQSGMGAPPPSLLSLPPGMNMNSRISQPPGLGHQLQQAQHSFGGSGAGLPASNAASSHFNYGRNGQAPAPPGGGGADDSGWNPSQFVQDVRSSLLFGGNSTWSMSSQESSQGLGSLWSTPVQPHPSAARGRKEGPGAQTPGPRNPRFQHHQPANAQNFLPHHRPSQGPLGQLGSAGNPQHVPRDLGMQQMNFTRGYHQPKAFGRPTADSDQGRQQQQQHGNNRQNVHKMDGHAPHLMRRNNDHESARKVEHFTGQGRPGGGVRLNPRRSQERSRQKYTKEPKWDSVVLQRQLKDIYLKLLPTREETAMKKKCFKKIQRILNKKFRGSALHMFGSSANNLGICKNHDIDLSIEIEVKPDTPDANSDGSGSETDADGFVAEDQGASSPNGNANANASASSPPVSEEAANKPTQQQVVKQMANLLRKNRMSKVFAIPKARVPIVKFIEPETGIECDICVNNLLAVENTTMLRRYSEIDPRLRELVILVKHWSKCRGVNGAFKGFLSSYAYVIMAIHLLQTVQPAILPCLQDDSHYKPTVDSVVDGWECRYAGNPDMFQGFGHLNKLTTADLLYQFFYYWGYRHNYKSSVICMRTGDWLTKEQKGWTTRKQGDNHLICIEDPFQLSNDLGRVVGRKTIFLLRDEFKRAYDILANSPDPIRPLFQKVDPKERKDQGGRSRPTED